MLIKPPDESCYKGNNIQELVMALGSIITPTGWKPQITAAICDRISDMQQKIDSLENKLSKTEREYTNYIQKEIETCNQCKGLK